MIISLAKAKYQKNYKIALEFSDKTIKVIDFEVFLKESLNPMTKAYYLDIEKFKAFTIQYGDLVWNDYEMCFPIGDLYEGKI